MKKKLCAVVFCVLMLTELAACGGTDYLALLDNSLVGHSVQQHEKTDISFQSQSDDISTVEIESRHSATEVYRSNTTLAHPDLDSRAADMQDETTIHYQPISLITQNPDLPNGCEVTSMAMVLASVGHPIDKMTLYDQLTRKPIFTRSGRRFGPNPETAYAGDAASKSGGWYCFEGPVIDAANNWLMEQESHLQAVSISGLNRMELEAYAMEGVPVVCWVTLSYANPKRSSYIWLLEDGSVYHPYSNLHCVVLTGAEGDTYQVADPINGISYIQKDLFWNSFSAMGHRAVIVE